MSSWITWPHSTPCDQWPPVLAYEKPWVTSAGGSSGIVEAGEDDSDADIGVASAEASGRFVEESGFKPRVLRSACAPCSEKWTNQYLTSAVQEGLEVDIDVGPPACRGHFPDTKEERLLSGVEELTVPFADLLCRLETVLPTPDHHAYLQQQSWPFDTVFPKLSADLRTASRRLVCPIVSGLIPQSTAKVMWLGVSPTCSQLHFDRKDNFICQMAGQKEILLWPQTESDSLYQRKDVDGTAFTDRFSEIDLRADAKQFQIKYPRALEPLPHRVILKPGDVLFVPKNWWHIVASRPDPERGINLMVNIFFESHERSKENIESAVPQS